MSRVEKLLASAPDEVPAEVSRLFTEYLTNEELVELSQKMKTGVTEADHKVALGMAKLKKRYEAHKTSEMMLNAVVQTGAVTVVAASDLLTGQGVGLSAAGGAVARAVTDRMADGVVSWFNKEMWEQGQNLIRRHIDTIREEYNLSREEVDGLSQEDARRLVLESKHRIIDSERLNFIEKEDRVAAIEQSTKILEDALTRGIALNEIAIHANAEDIEAVKSSVVVLRNGHVETEKAINLINSNLGAIQSNLENVHGKLGALRERTDLNSRDIKVLQDVAYSGASLKDKIYLLRSGVGSLPPVEREKEIAKLEAMEARETLKQDIQQCVEDGRHVLTIAKNLGVDIPDEVDQLANIAQVGMTAYTAYLSGNPLAAASAVSGLFGGGGSGDAAAAQRHAEIMKKLAVIDEKLDEVLKNQRKILEAIFHLFTMLEDLSKQIQDLHGEVMNQLQQNLGATLHNRLVINDLINRQILNFIRFAQRVREQRVANSGLTVEVVRDLLRDHGPEFAPVLADGSALVAVLNQTKDLDSYLELRTYEGDGHQPDPDASNQIKVVLDGFKAALEYRDSLPASLSDDGFYLPAPSVKELEKRMSLAFDPIGIKDDILGQFISSKHFCELAAALIELHPLFSIYRMRGTIHDCPSSEHLAQLAA